MTKSLGDKCYKKKGRKVEVSDDFVAVVVNDNGAKLDPQLRQGGGGIVGDGGHAYECGHQSVFCQTNPARWRD